MTSDTIQVLHFIFTQVWSLFTSFVIPGTHVTIAEWALFALLVSLTLRFTRQILGPSENDDSE